MNGKSGRLEEVFRSRCVCVISKGEPFPDSEVVREEAGSY